MAVLNEELQEKIDDLGELAYEKFQNNEIEESFNLMEQAWSLYPEPKENWNEAFNTAREITDDCFKIKDFNRAKIWLDNMTKVNNNLHQDDDYLAYYMGKYHFEIGNFEKALTSFKEVVEEAGFRYFESDDPKYLDFYRNSKKYM